MEFRDGLAREVIMPKSKEEWLTLRTRDITSTDIAALFDISPYMTRFELWHQKKDGMIVGIEESERMKWGTRLQDSIAQGIVLDEHLAIRPMREYIRIPSLSMGSSFDFSIFDKEAIYRSILLNSTVTSKLTYGIYEKTERIIGEEVGLLEIKNVDALAFKDGWTEDEVGNLEAPPHIEIQVQHQLAVSGRSFAYIGALVGGNKVALIRREPDQDVIEAIKMAVAEFWKSIEANEPPAPDFSRDAKMISRLYGFAEPGKLLDLRGNEHTDLLMEKYKAAQSAEKQAAEAKEAIKAEILTLIGDAEKVLGDAYTISSGIVGECPINYTRKAYRSFKASFKKVKA